MKHEIDEIRRSFAEHIAGVHTREALDALQLQYFGRKGVLALQMKSLATLPVEEKKRVGEELNQLKAELLASLSEVEKTVALHEAAHAAEREWIDVTVPGAFPKAGHLHLVTSAIEEITDIFSQIGFVRVNAPEVDWDFYAFESLNMPKDHPARDDWETFFVGASKNQEPTGKKGRMVLTPHTSNSQVREMEKGSLPIRMININRTYRRQSDVTHVPMFHQFEGLCVQEGVTIADLKGVLEFFAKTYFGEERRIRLRPHHFRFTEPSFEIDISCDVCGGKKESTCRVCKSGWLELGGAGMVHPNVLRSGGLDGAVVSGFAFGWGVERTLMMREGLRIDDIRTIYRNDLRFLRQF